MGIKEEEREKGAENIFKEIIAENVPNLGKKLNIEVHEANRTHYFTTKKTSCVSTLY